jgi:hypothetical protein
VAGKCFVIQPFDGGEYDARYRETIKPALEEAGLSVHRIDEDPSVTLIMDEVERRIRDADVVLADITESNPNVWFELGLAMASPCEVIMIRQKGTEPHPFDVRHRRIIEYQTGAASYLEQLANEIRMTGEALLETERKIERAQALTPLERGEDDLSESDIVALCVVAEDSHPGDLGIYIVEFENSMRRRGYMKLAAVISERRLSERSLIARVADPRYENEERLLLRATKHGLDWLETNFDVLELKSDHNSEDDIPF